jgi:protocatechuate 3,4-dioxygenase, beta subunit
MILILATSITACSQQASENKSGKLIGGGCEGCEAVHEYGSKKLSWVDTLPDYNDPGPKMEVSGTIYQKDGKTPAKDVILYVYHTDQTGVYPTKGNETGWARRHGYIRGWVKTNGDGKYKFYTLLPAAYPGREFPAHIHPTVKEPGKNEYWIDEFVFDDDPLLTKNERAKSENRGGSGILKVQKNADGILVANRDIILGLNVPDYR